jgi:hypothetical protein
MGGHWKCQKENAKHAKSNETREKSQILRAFRFISRVSRSQITLLNELPTIDMIDNFFSLFRTSEWVNFCCYMFFSVVAWVRPLALRRRLEIIAIAVAGAALTCAGILLARQWPSLITTAIRDLLPAPLIIFAYWQSGRFYVRPNVRIQNLLLRLDEKIMGPILRRQDHRRGDTWLGGYLELSYLMCYPLVPLGVCVLYAMGKQQHINEYWMIVLPSTYLCYMIIPFVQMLPPRMLAPESDREAHSDKLRMLNLEIIKRASIKINTFPSAHVASTISVSLALLSFVPVAGVLFLFMALSIAGGAVLGRYHYLADAVLGILFAVAVFCFECKPG